MRFLSISLFSAFIFGVASLAAADSSQICYEMYPQDAYGMEDRNLLINECLKSYEPDPVNQDTVNHESYSEAATEETTYYDGSVEDYVNELPTEE